MLIEAIQRTEQTDASLLEMPALADSVPLGDVRACHGRLKSVGAAVDECCAEFPLLISALHRHGGVGVGGVMDSTGASQRQAPSHVWVASICEAGRCCVKRVRLLGDDRRAQIRAFQLMSYLCGII